ncbi:MAG: hypothetical protein AAF502_06910 [Bacteroidota bacterium]
MTEKTEKIIPKTLENWKLPETMKWYLEPAKWLVALSTALIAFGFSILKENPGLNMLEKLIFAFIALLLLVAAGSGILSYFFTISYSNRMELAVREGQSPAEANNKHNWLHKCLGFWHNSLLLSFTLGVVFISIFAAHVIIFKKTPEKPMPAKNYTLTTLDDSTYKNVVLEMNTGEMWVLKSDSTGKMRVIPIEFEFE